MITDISALEAQKNAIYNWLTKEFEYFTMNLNTAELQTEMDGKLWKLAGTLADAGILIGLGFALEAGTEKSSLQKE